MITLFTLLEKGTDLVFKLFFYQDEGVDPLDAEFFY